jgi:hypothetical protein
LIRRAVQTIARRRRITLLRRHFSGTSLTWSLQPTAFA